ncbi:MAG: tRNA (adenosine(37)-N6)-threonylcarbamoyltransferase complex transferase subunit TsaD [Spirochaetes bacterium]|nr:tRNA (adenosine(37)-N6)-threonylcarbamoyltransferase complex transferase subunit TsaD [Spirochaetota bacterium]
MKILGIDTSCDDTSVAVVENGNRVLSSLLSSQVDVHRIFSGVVPEIAARKHLEAIIALVDEALRESQTALSDIDAIAVTNRPGLVGSLLVGVGAAKGLSVAADKPVIAVDHIAAHIYSVHLTNEIPFPYIGLIVSGGHTLIVRVNAHNDYTVIGTTLDDAVGEAYDKIAKHLGLGYPGGPIIDKLAASGDANAIKYPRAMLSGDDRYNFSFSGLKTAVVYQTPQCIRKGENASMENIAAAFQESAVSVLYDKTLRYSRDSGISNVTVSGGVACNSYLRKKFSESRDFKAYIPERKYTTDNAAMVGGLGFHVKEKNDDRNISCFSRVISRR